MCRQVLMVAFANSVCRMSRPTMRLDKSKLTCRRLSDPALPDVRLPSRPQPCKRVRSSPRRQDDASRTYRRGETDCKSRCCRREQKGQVRVVSPVEVIYVHLCIGLLLYTYQELARRFARCCQSYRSSAVRRESQKT